GSGERTRGGRHERDADWLEQRNDGLGAFVGYHLEQSYRYRTELAPLDDEIRTLGERAAAHLATAAARADDRGDYPAAANLLERALAVGITTLHQRVRAQFDLAQYLGRSGRRSEASALKAEVRDTATRLGDRALLARFRLEGAISPMFTSEASFQEMGQVSEEVIATLTELGDERGLAEAQ